MYNDNVGECLLLTTGAFNSHNEVRREYKGHITKTSRDESIVESQSYCEREQSYGMPSALVGLNTMVFYLCGIVRMYHGKGVGIAYIF